MSANVNFGGDLTPTNQGQAVRATDRQAHTEKDCGGRPDPDRRRTIRQNNARQMKDGETIYHIRFRTPPDPEDGKTDFYFSSLAAIYDTFTPEQVGCAVQRLWNVKVTEESPYTGKLCEITKERVKRKAQKRPCKRTSEDG